MTSTTAGFFSGYAHDFDSIYGVANNALHNRVINSVFRKSMFLRYEKTIAGCDPIQGRTVLDVGSGSGHFSIALAARGAARVLGVDFADSMVEIAKQKAKEAGVADRCEFRFADFINDKFDEQFDYAVVCGFMDYMEHPRDIVAKVLSLTKVRAFFSFPVAGGLLGWQRQRRYRTRCPLYLYTEERVRDIMTQASSNPFTIEKISRDFFVTVNKVPGK